MPADVKVNDPDCPAGSRPVSHKPASLVAVWTEGPLFVQTIVSPTCTSVLGGRNAKSTMITAARVGDGAPVTGVAGPWATGGWEPLGVSAHTVPDPFEVPAAFTAETLKQ